jgi:hypothetical protein
LWQVLLPAFNATPEGPPCEVHADSKAETFSSTLKIAVQCKATDKLCNHNLHVDSKAEVLSSTLKIAPGVRSAAHSYWRPSLQGMHAESKADIFSSELKIAVQIFSRTARTNMSANMRLTHRPQCASILFHIEFQFYTLLEITCYTLNV